MANDRASSVTAISSAGWSRWGICALLFFATTLNYIDRQVIGILKPELSKQLGWNEIDYSNIVFAFLTSEPIGKLTSTMPIRPGRFDGCVPL